MASELIDVNKDCVVESDNDLLLRFQNGDEQAFVKIIEWTQTMRTTFPRFDMPYSAIAGLIFSFVVRDSC